MWQRLQNPDRGRTPGRTRGRAGVSAGPRESAADRKLQHAGDRRLWRAGGVWRLWAGLGVLLLGCSGAVLGDTGYDEDGGASDLQGSGPRQLRQLRVTPDNEVMEVDLNQSAARDFTVRALYSDGSSEDVTAQATLKLEDTSLGQLTGAHFVSAVSTVNKVAFTRVSAALSRDGAMLSGLANLTLVWLRKSGVATDFFFKLPYKDAPQSQPLQFSTNVQSLDAFFAVDTTGSMGPEIQQLSMSLQNTIIPGVKANAVKDAWFGVGAVEDFPYAGHGAANAYPGQSDDQPFILLKAMTADSTAAGTAVGQLLRGAAPRGNGLDLPEGQLEALYQIATGAGNQVSGVVNIPPNHSGLGGVGFRKGALPVITLITDAIFHTKGEPTQSCTYRYSGGGSNTEHGDYEAATAAVAHSRSQVTTALNQLCARFVGVSALYTNITGLVPDPNGICNATADLIQAANATGSVVLPVAWDVPSRPNNCAAGLCCTGLNGAGEAPNANGECPLVFKIPQTGLGLGSQVTAGITQVARFGKFDVSTQTSGLPTGDGGITLPAGKTTADFIQSVAPLDATAPKAPPVLPAPQISGGAFTKVYPGSTVRFTVTAQNVIAPATDKPQVFRAKIKVLAGGCADLDEREVIILVPPAAPPNIG